MFASNTSQVSSAANYIEDVFSTYLYAGNSSTQTITNGIDLAGKGGMVWFKNRTYTFDHQLYDTARGSGKLLYSNLTNAQASVGTGLTAFTSSGFTIGSSGGINDSTSGIASWSFRKAAKFFDVVTYTGNGANRTISHNLGSAPGCIIVKCTSDVTDWAVYHRSLSSATNALQLNTTGAQFSIAGYWNSTAPTSTVFSVGNDNDTNGTGRTYVAYLFAHDAGGFGTAGSDNVISCGSYTGNGSATGPTITLGYEPQWVMVKRSDSTSNWTIFDTMRGMSQTAANLLYANLADDEGLGTQGWVVPTATGFQLAITQSSVNASGGTYIYIAIRRGPMQTPTSGTSVFSPVTQSANTTTVTTNFPVDLSISAARNGADQTTVIDRLRGGAQSTNSYWLYTASSSSEGNAVGTAGLGIDNNTGIVNNYWGSVYRGNSGNIVYWSFRRAPSFFDEICYKGNSTAGTVLNHNLAVTPELIITRVRNFSGEDWVVNYNSGSSIIGGYLNSTSAFANSSTAPSTDLTSLTSTTYTLNTSNRRVNAGYNYVAYLFATCPGVSKVGSYTGTGTTKQIDCGFTGGARFVLIKRTDSTGDWYVWDSARGIVAGNDPYLLLNSTAAEVTNTDYVDTYSAGFELSSTAPAAINANGGTFIFLAIA